MNKAVSGRVLVAVLVLAVLGLVLSIARWSTKPASSFTIIDWNQKRYIYSVKCTCVPEVGAAETPEGVPFQPGVYRTVVNVHNFQETRQPITIRKKAVLALSEDDKRRSIRPLPRSDWRQEELEADEALSVDCADVKQLLGPIRTRVPQYRLTTGDGFVVIESVVPLDVAAVYTARGRDGGDVSIDVEYIQPQIIERTSPGMADLFPTPDPATHAYCAVIDGRWSIVVRVRNQGTVAAPATTTTVTFVTSGGPVVSTLPTPAIPAGAEVTLPAVPVPPGCFIPDCRFTIAVDANSAVAEVDETNNKADARCQG